MDQTVVPKMLSFCVILRVFYSKHFICRGFFPDIPNSWKRALHTGLRFEVLEVEFVANAKIKPRCLSSSFFAESPPNEWPCRYCIFQQRITAMQHFFENKTNHLNCLVCNAKCGAFPTNVIIPVRPLVS